MPAGKATVPFSIHATHTCSRSPMPGTVLGAGLPEMKGPVSDSKIRADTMLSRRDTCGSSTVAHAWDMAAYRKVT